MKNTLTLEQFNAIVSPRKVVSNHDNDRIIAKLAAAGCTADDVQAFVNLPEYSVLTGHVLRRFAAFYFKGKKPQAKPEVKPQAKPEAAADNAADALTAALSAFIGNQKAASASVDTEAVRQIAADVATEIVNAAIKAAKPSQIEIKIGDDVRPIKGTAHYMLQDVLADLMSGENVYLYGPAGTGKTVLAKQCAEALGVPFYFTSKIDEVFQLTGFMDANSRYNETELYRCMKTGGVFLFDEMDASAPEALTAFNALLANGIMDFPTGKLAKPENMYIIAAGNTNGRGGTAEYNTRQPIDCATLDRFVVEEIGYDSAIENALADSFADKKLGKDAVEIVRVMRRFAERNGLEIIASYRTITRLGKLAQVKGVSKAVVSCIKNKMSEDDYITMQAYGEMRKLQERGNVFAAAICQ